MGYNSLANEKHWGSFLSPSWKSLSSSWALGPIRPSLLLVKAGKHWDFIVAPTLRLCQSEGPGHTGLVPRLPMQERWERRWHRWCTEWSKTQQTKQMKGQNWRGCSLPSVQGGAGFLMLTSSEPCAKYISRSNTRSHTHTVLKHSVSSKGQAVWDSFGESTEYYKATVMFIMLSSHESVSQVRSPAQGQKEYSCFLPLVSATNSF